VVVRRRQSPPTWRAFVRARLVAADVAATYAGTPWWSAADTRPAPRTPGRRRGHPAGAAALLAGAAAAVAAPSTDLDHRWLLPLRQTGSGCSGTRWAGIGCAVPLAATVELLERSLAWESAARVVRSGLVERIGFEHQLVPAKIR